jgi:hypothetical protein
LAEDGPISEAYNLVELPTESYEARTEENVLQSDGTILFSRGDLKGGSRYTQEVAQRHGRACLHIDLQEVNSFEAARRINHWIAAHDIRILNVAGPRASQDPWIYDLVRKVMKAAFFMSLVHAGTPDAVDLPDRPIARERGATLPKTVGEAVSDLISQMNLREKTRMANMKEEALSLLQESLGRHILERYRLGSENMALMASCGRTARKKNMDAERACRVIIRALWKKLREAHVLRVVK